MKSGSWLHRPVLYLGGRTTVLFITIVLVVITAWVSGLSVRAGGGDSLSRLDDSQDQEGARLVAARCAVCHSTDLIHQQRLSGERWKAIMEKMIHWGAQLDEKEQAMLVGFLAKHFHPEAGPVGALPTTPPTLFAERAGGPLPHAGVAARGGALYKQNCLPCHGENGSGGIGPKLARNPILAQEDRFYTTVTQGRGAMPAWGSVLKPLEIADIHAWLATLAE